MLDDACQVEDAVYALAGLLQLFVLQDISLDEGDAGGQLHADVEVLRRAEGRRVLACRAR